MENNPPSNPWLDSLLPRNNPKTPPPGILDQLMRTIESTREAPKLPPDEVARYLRSLETPPMSSPVSAKTPEPPPPVEPPVLQKIGNESARARKAISDGKLNKAVQIQWVSRLFFLLKPFYGKQAPLIAMLDEWRKEITKAPLSTEEFLARLQQVDHYLYSFQEPANLGSFTVASQRSLVPATKDVFVIHGHDEINQLRLSKLLREDFKLSPVVLLDKPGRSAPTIEKFEQHAKTCSYAIALFTADDHVTTKAGDQYWQARPNVIFETAWFVGRLGKERVLILLQNGVKIYSDFDGVNRISFESDVEDKFRRIRSELEAAGLVSGN